MERKAPLSPALSPHLYSEPEALEIERARVLERNWTLVGHLSDLPAPGNYMTTQVGTQPVLVVRTLEGELRAFRNVCRHRGSRLLSGSGECGKAIRCRYHGWTYRLDGSLIGVPEVRSYEGRLDKSDYGLFPVRIEVVFGLVFVNLDPVATPLSELLGDLPDRLARYDIPSLVPHQAVRGQQRVNWKIIADNYLEGYHVPIAHPGLMRLLDYQRYDVEIHDHYVWFEAPLRDEPTSGRMERLYWNWVRPMAGLEEADANVWRYIFIYPNTAIDLYPDQVGTWRMSPQEPRLTYDHFRSYREARQSLRMRFVRRLNTRLNVDVQTEDEDLTANVQAGLETRGFQFGPLSGRERAVAWFADRIRADLGPLAERPPDRAARAGRALDADADPPRLAPETEPAAR